MKISDFICQRLAEFGVRHVFGVTGGAVVHLLDSAESNPNLKVIYTHHEQSAAFAATAASRIKNLSGACFVTTGPGGTNALTGLASAWLDSIPCIFISGQARSEDVLDLAHVRQVSSQHIDIIALVRSISKWSLTLSKENNKIIEALFEMEAALKTGRPGPVWLDIPLDIQWAEIEPSLEKEYLSRRLSLNLGRSPKKLSKELDFLSDALNFAERPLFLLGYGVRLSKTQTAILELLDKHNIPFVTTWNTIDFGGKNDHNYMGVLGITGTRDANLSTKYCDLLVCLGSHLSKQLTGDSLEKFCTNAKVLIFDIDEKEAYRFREQERFYYSVVDLCDLVNNDEFESVFKNSSEKWVNEYNVIKSYRNYGIDEAVTNTIAAEDINQYDVYDKINDGLNSGDIVVVDGGGNVLFSAVQNTVMPSRESRLITGAGIGCMGSGLPEAIGAAFSGQQRVICYIGDGSIMFNLQELETIRYHSLNIIIVLFNNDGYLAIKNTQDAYFSRRFGVDAETGISTPEFKGLCEAFDFPYLVYRRASDLENFSATFRDLEGPLVVEIKIPQNTPLIPRGGFRNGLDGKNLRRQIWDLYPDLDGEVI